MKELNIMGSVAGDDTIFILLRNEEQAAALTKDFKAMLKKR
jgi:arginine repressor